MKIRERRVGTITLGAILIFYGGVFLLHSFVEGISYYLIFRLWPVIFLALGIEVLFASIRWKDEGFKYDFAAILIICILLFFAMGMAGMDWLYVHEEICHSIRRW